METNYNEYYESEEQETSRPRSKPDPDFYHQPFSELFKTIAVEHETEKAILFYTNKGSFWCPKKMVRIKDKKDIMTWKIWKSFEYKFLPAKEA